jgi:transcriptional regulator with XRE-family HTH domain
VDVREAKKARYSAERAQALAKFGATLKALRKERGFRTQEALADAAGFHLTYIGLLERGQREPGLLSAVILADTLNVSLDRLSQGLHATRARRPAPIAEGSSPTNP